MLLKIPGFFLKHDVTPSLILEKPVVPKHVFVLSLVLPICSVNLEPLSAWRTHFRFWCSDYVKGQSDVLMCVSVEGLLL